MEENLAAWMERVDNSVDVAQLIEALASYRGGPPISDADGKVLTIWANTLAQQAILANAEGVITAIADTGIDQVKAGLLTHDPDRGYTPACLAAACDNDAAITELAKTGIPLVLTKRGTPQSSYFTPADAAARYGNDNVIAALADTCIPEVLASLSKRNLLDQCTPAERAALRGSHKVISALARIEDPQLRATLSEDPSQNRGPIYRAAFHGKLKVIEALAETEIPAVLDIFKEKGASLAASARLLRHDGTAVAILEATTFAMELPRDEKALLEALHGDLAASTRPEALDLVTDTQCVITAQPFATVGPRRPVYLHDQNGVPDRRHCISHSAILQQSEGAVKNPLTNLAFTGFAEAPDRIALIRDLVEACRQKPDATPEALFLYGEYLKRAAGVPCTERPLAQYETVLAAAAGAGAGPSPRRAAEP